LVVVTLQYDELRYAGVVKRGFTPEIGKELLKRLRTLHCSDPFIPTLNLKAIWVKPELFCEIRQSGFDERGQLLNPSFGNLLSRK
jgi:ATP-dependent DNA ligase